MRPHDPLWAPRPLWVDDIFGPDPNGTPAMLQSRWRYGWLTFAWALGPDANGTHPFSSRTLPVPFLARSWEPLFELALASGRFDEQEPGGFAQTPDPDPEAVAARAARMGCLWDSPIALAFVARALDFEASIRGRAPDERRNAAVDAATQVSIDRELRRVRLLVSACSKWAASEEASLRAAARSDRDTDVEGLVAMSAQMHSQRDNSEPLAGLRSDFACLATLRLAGAHAVGERGTVPLDWALYLPEEWCEDLERRRKAKIPDEVQFQTKPELATGLIERAASWEIATAPVLGDEAYGKNTELRTRLDRASIEYVLSINADACVYEPDTVFTVPERKRGSRGPAPSALVSDREPRQITELAASLAPEDYQTLVYTTRDGEEIRSRFATVRVIAAHPVERDRCAPREEWLIIEWPEDAEQPSDYWISNLPADTAPERLARLARLRWMIELDYRQLKGELGLDHYEGRSYLGFHHHCAIVTAAHGFLTLERADPNRQRPA